MTLLISSRRLACAVVCLAMALPAASGAQEPRRLLRSDSIPVDLATALIAAGGLGGEPQILVGAVPGWVSDRVSMPANARVLGSAFVGNTVVGVLSLPDPPETVIADFRREQLKRGWTPPPPPPTYGGGGFRNAPIGIAAPDAIPTRLTLCGNQQILTTSAARHFGTSTQVVVRLAPAPTYGTCNPMPGPVATRAAMPTVFNPPMVDPRGGFDCVSAMNNSSGMSTNLRTTVAPQALLDHYGKQLVDSGWHVASNRAMITGTTWTRLDSAGTPLEATLTIATSLRDSTCRDVNMQVRWMSKP